MAVKRVLSAIVIITSLLNLAVAGTATTAKVGRMRNTRAIGEEAVRKGIIKPPPANIDFTKIPSGAVYKPGELMVRFTPKPDGKSPAIAGKNRILASLGGGTLKRNYDIVPGLTLVKLPKGMTVEQALKKFNKASGILYAEPDYFIPFASTFPDDPYGPDPVSGGSLWGLHNIGQLIKGTSGTPNADIDAPEAWDISTGSSGIIVAVIGSGVDYNHLDLADNMWVNEDEELGDSNGDGFPGMGGVDDDEDGLIDEDSIGNSRFLEDDVTPNPDWINDIPEDDDENGYVDDIRGWDFSVSDNDPMDIYGHGTHCAGIISAVGKNGEGVVGVCWNAQIMALNISHYLSGEWGVFVSSAIEAINYAVANGAKVLSNSWGNTVDIPNLKDAIDVAGAAGVLFVAAAANKDPFPYLNNDECPIYPASYNSDNIIAVLATDKNDYIWSDSHYGATSVDLGAPGSEILSCILYDGYGFADGTSMAAPYVAGAAALIWSAKPGLTSTAVKGILLDTVDPLSELSDKCVSGGRLNLYNALLETTIEQIPWLQVSPPQGQIGPCSSTDINVDFSAETIWTGTYNGLITITFNDPQGTKIKVPATLTVQK